MEKTFKLMCIVLCLGYFSGCTVSHQIIKPNYIGNDGVIITVKRPSAFKACACALYLHMDNMVVCEIQNGKEYIFTIKPGKHIFSVSDCAKINGNVIQINLQGGNKYNIKMFYIWNYGPQMSINKIKKENVL